MMRLAPFAQSMFVENTDKTTFSIVATPEPVVAAPVVEAPVAEVQTPAPTPAPAPAPAPKTKAKAHKKRPKDTMKTPTEYAAWNKTLNRPSAKSVVMGMLESGKPVSLADMRRAVEKLGYAKNTTSSTLLHLKQSNRVTHTDNAMYMLRPAEASA